MSGRQSAVFQKLLQCVVIIPDGPSDFLSRGRGHAGDSHSSSSETGRNQELLPLIRPAEHSSSSSGALHPHPGRCSVPGSANLDGDTSQPCLGFGDAGISLGEQEQPHGSSSAWTTWKTLTQYKGQAQDSCARIPVLRQL